MHRFLLIVGVATTTGFHVAPSGGRPMVLKSTMVRYPPPPPVTTEIEEEPVPEKRNPPQITEKDPWSVALRVFPLAFGHGMWAFFITWFLSREKFVQVFFDHLGGVGTQVHILLGGVLGLLTAFRTNQAYGRYWRATEAMGELRAGLVAVARKLAFLNDGDALDKRLYRATIRHLLAMPIAVKHYLRGDDDEDLNIDDEFYSSSGSSVFRYDGAAPYVSILNSAELNDLVEVRDAFGVPPPHALFSSLYVLVRPVLASDDGRGVRLTLWTSICGSLDRAADAYGVLKTIRHSVQPRSYALHVRRFLMLWLATLPVALLSADVSFNPLGAALISFASAWALYSTDELAHIVGQPFDRLVDDPRVVRLKWRAVRWWHSSTRSVNRVRHWRPRWSRRPPDVKEEEPTAAEDTSADVDDLEDDDDDFEDEIYPSSIETPAERSPPMTLDDTLVEMQQSTTTTFPLDEWADALITTLRHHVLVQSVLDSRIRSRTWVVQPEACVQKPPPGLLTDDDDTPPQRVAPQKPREMRKATSNSTTNSTDDNNTDDDEAVDPDVV